VTLVTVGWRGRFGFGFVVVVVVVVGFVSMGSREGADSRRWSSC